MANWISIEQAGCLQTGDIVEVPSKIPGTDIVVPMVQHYGIILHICDIKYVTHIPWGQRPVMETVEKFEDRRKIKRVMRCKTPLTNEQIFGNYSNLSSRKYDFFNRNCEDYVSDMTKQDLGFDQRRAYFIGLLVLIILLILIFRK